MGKCEKFFNTFDKIKNHGYILYLLQCYLWMSNVVMSLLILCHLKPVCNSSEIQLLDKHNKIMFVSRQQTRMLVEVMCQWRTLMTSQCC